jgi:hypothetical protein
MKRIIVVAVLVTALMALVAGTALAAGPVAWGRAQTAPPVQQGTATCPMLGAGEGQGMMGGRPAWAGQTAAVPELLSLTAAEIQAERKNGRSLADIALDKGIDTETLVNTILGAKTDMVSDLVAGGKLTKEQADAMIERMRTQVETMVSRTDTGPAAGRGQGMRQGMGRGMEQGTRQGMGRGMEMRGWQSADR